MLERDVEARLVRGVKALGGRCYKWVSPGNVGVPDRIAVFPGGDVAFVELKTETGKTRPAQDVQIEKLRALGACVVVLHGPDEVDEFIEYRRVKKISRPRKRGEPV